MRHYGLIGHPLTHSFSREYFTEKFRKLHLENIHYSLFNLASLEYLCDLVAVQSVNGFNVTIPYKETVIPYLDVLTQEAREIGAVNCVRVDGSVWTGYNTDAYGFQTSLQRLLNGRAITQALVLGSGGSSKAVQYVLKQMGIGFRVVSRSKEFSYAMLTPSHIREAELIVNTTPVGMYPDVNHCPDIPYEAIAAQHIAFDLVYNPGESMFLKRCRLLGATTKNGLEMLQLQADRSWEIWDAPAAQSS